MSGRFGNLSQLKHTEFLYIMLGQYSIPECSVSPGDVVFDVGAHFGFFSYYAVKKGAERVYAFEPNPYVFRVLKKNSRLWEGDIQPFQLALYSERGWMNLFISDDTGTVSTLLEDTRGTALENFRFKKRVEVKTLTMDEFVRQKGVDRVDFIKIDTEGAERDIIKGAKRTIKRFKPKIAVSAYHLQDDREEIPELVLSIRDDYDFRIVKKGEEDLFFF